ncbi:hypothetical protein BGX33_011863 [Mortierella sp. NVP41]|nr:hypothetical protein BGX33_011863 [Mortierella sp. NVP41]
MDPEKFPALKNEYCNFTNKLPADKPYSWNTLTTCDTICWGATRYLDAESPKFHNNLRRTD